MSFNQWCLFVGVMLIAIALSGTLLKRLPVSTALLYLVVGYAMGPYVMPTLSVSALEFAERLTEIAVLVSLFAVGVKLGLPLQDRRWRLPIRLATISMVLTIGLTSALAYAWLGLPFGAAVLLAAILAPTDPVLASDVQVADVSDRDRLRFALTGEGGLNDGAAFPFVMLGLGLLGLHELGAAGWRWWAVDVVWAVGAGLAIGMSLGMLTGKLVVHLRTRHQEAVGLDEFLVLGLIGLAYGAAQLAHAYGFLAVFAAGVGLLRVSANRRSSALQRAPAQTDAETTSSEMMIAMQGFTTQLERICEFAVVLLVGVLLRVVEIQWQVWWFAPLLFFAVRPFAVWLGLRGEPLAQDQRWLMAWFGIRGIGSVYYLTYAANHGLDPATAHHLMSVTLTIVAVSIVLHGMSVTPLMNLYARRKKRVSASPQRPL